MYTGTQSRLVIAVYNKQPLNTHKKTTHVTLLTNIYPSLSLFLALLFAFKCLSLSLSLSLSHSSHLILNYVGLYAICEPKQCLWSPTLPLPNQSPHSPGETSGQDHPSHPVPQPGCPGPPRKMRMCWLLLLLCIRLCLCMFVCIDTVYVWEKAVETFHMASKRIYT